MSISQSLIIHPTPKFIEEPKNKNQSNIQMPNFEFIEARRLRNDKKAFGLELTLKNLGQLVNYIKTKAEEENFQFVNKANAFNEDVSKYKFGIATLSEILGKDEKIQLEKSIWVKNSLNKLKKINSQIYHIKNEISEIDFAYIKNEIVQANSEVQQAISDITRDQLIIVYNNLSASFDNVEISVMNAFVSLLSGDEKAAPDVCEVYLRKFENLVMRLSSFKGENLQKTTLDYLENILQSNFSRFNPNSSEDSSLIQKYQHLVSFTNWSLKAIKLSKLINTENEMSVRKEELEFNLNKKLAKCKFVEELINESKKEKEVFFEKKQFDYIKNSLYDIIDRKNMQIQSIKSYLDEFLSEYFGQLIYILDDQRVYIEHLYLNSRTFQSKLDEVNMISVREFLNKNKATCGSYSCFKN